MGALVTCEGWQVGSYAAKTPAKFQCDRKYLNTHMMPLRLCKIIRNLYWIHLCKCHLYACFDVYNIILSHWGWDKWPPFSRRHFQMHFLNENVWISIKISLKFVRKGVFNNFPVLGQIMAWRPPGDKPLSEPMMESLLTHICVTRPQWVKHHDGMWGLSKIMINNQHIHCPVGQDK